MRTECPTPLEERGDCPWQDRKGGCFADTDHIVSQRYAFMGLLVRKYIQTPENKQQLCRYEHDQKTETETPDLVPDEAFMLSAVHSAWRSGDLRLTRQQYQRLFAVENGEAA